MIHRLVEATTDPTAIHVGLADHQAEMIRRCPYLGPSVERGFTIWSSWRADPGDQVQLFSMLIESAESLRHARRVHGPLVCRNIALFGPPDLDAARSLMDWPVWIARNLYAPVQMMIGRFWVGVRLNDSKGSAMLPPPVSFFSMRHSIPTRDGLFLASKLPEIMAILEAGPGDDGRDVFEEPLGRPVNDPASVYYELAKAFPNPHPEE